MFVTTFSSIQSLPACQVFRIAVLDATVDGVVAIPEGWLLAPTGKIRSSAMKNRSPSRIQRNRIYKSKYYLFSSFGYRLSTTRAISTSNF